MGHTHTETLVFEEKMGCVKKVFTGAKHTKRLWKMEGCSNMVFQFFFFFFIPKLFLDTAEKREKKKQLKVFTKRVKW